MESEVVRLDQRMEANLTDAETAVCIARAAHLAERVRQGLDDLQVSDAKGLARVTSGSAPFRPVR